MSSVFHRGEAQRQNQTTTARPDRDGHAWTNGHTLPEVALLATHGVMCPTTIIFEL